MGEFGKKYSPCLFRIQNSSINKIQPITENTEYKSLKKVVKNLKQPIIVSRQNLVPEEDVLKDFLSITGCNSSSSFVYHSRFDNEIYEILANGKLASVIF